MRKVGRKKIMPLKRELEKNLRTSLAEKLRDKHVLHEIKPRLSLEEKIPRIKLKYFTHIVKTEESLVKAIVLERTEETPEKTAGRHQRQHGSDY